MAAIFDIFRRHFPLRRKPKNYALFAEFLRAPPTYGPKNLELSVAEFVEKIERKPARNETVQSMENRWYEYAAKVLGGDQPVSLIVEERLQNYEFDKIQAPLAKLVIKGHGSIPKIELSGRRIGALVVQGNRSDLILEGCFIERLDVADNSNCLLKMRNCWIKSLNVSAKSLRHFEFIDGGIFALHCETQKEANPFTGPVVIKNIYLPREHGTEMNPQRLRDIRAHLLERHNVLAAGYFHSAELALDRPNESFLNRQFSRLYEIGSDFGNSTTRPLVWFVTTLSAMFLVAFISDGLVLVDESPKGWKSAMDGAAFSARALRSFVYPFTSIFNPIAIFNSKPILVAASPCIAFLLGILSVFGALSLVFLVLAIRRRFRLE